MEELELEEGALDALLRRGRAARHRAADAARATEEPVDGLPRPRSPRPPSDSLQLFLRDISQRPLLTAVEEIELAKRIERGDQRAKDR